MARYRGLVELLRREWTGQGVVMVVVVMVRDSKRVAYTPPLSIILRCMFPSNNR